MRTSRREERHDSLTSHSSVSLEEATVSLTSVDLRHVNALVDINNVLAFRVHLNIQYAICVILPIIYRNLTLTRTFFLSMTLDTSPT